MRTFRKAAVVALVIECVCVGLMYLGEHDFLAPLHLDFLALAAMLLHLAGVVITSGNWADKLPPAAFAGILFLVQWLVWIAIVEVCLLLQDHCRRRQTPTWIKLCAAAAFVCFAILLVSRWNWPPSPSQSARPVRAPQGVTVSSVKVDGLDADFFHGISGQPQKAVILLGGSEGGKSWSDATDFIQALVDQGFCVLSLGYFGTSDLPSQLRDIPLEYFPKAFRWLATQKQVVIPGQYALVGASKGAELALLLGSHYPEVKAVVAIAPSSVVFPGSPASKLDALRGQHSSWSLGGYELAFVPAPYGWATLRGMITGKYTPMFETALRHARRVKEAAIPVENIQSPILLVSFKRDQVWPSSLMSEQIMQRLRDHTFGFPYEHAAYDATHCEWSIQPCRTKILTFLREQFLMPAQDRRPPVLMQNTDSARGKS
jgi:hypothetical protein